MLAGESSPAERERLKTAINDRHRLRRPGTGSALDNAGVGRGTDRAAPVRLEGFAAATPRATIMPGGFCRIAEQLDARAVSMGDGTRAADVWVVSDRAVPPTTLLPAGDTCGSGASPAGSEPGRRQSVLAWPLPRARRGDIAAGGRSRRRCAIPRGIVNRASLGGTNSAPSRGRAHHGPSRRRSRRGAAKRGQIWLGPVAGALLAQRTATSLRERLSPDAWQVITETAERLGEEGRG